MGICDKLHIGYRLAPPERFLAAIAYKLLVPKLQLGNAIAGQSSSFESLKRSFLSHLRSQTGAWEEMKAGAWEEMKAGAWEEMKAGAWEEMKAEAWGDEAHFRC